MRFFSLFFLFLLLGCSESSNRIEGKLSSYLQEDLKFMVAEDLKSSNNREGLLDSPYYVIRDLRHFEGAEARRFAAYTEVDFFIYKDIALYQKRKYRYDTDGRRWDRYFKKMLFSDHFNKK